MCLQVIEYASDLGEFWKRGYGHDINSKASCGLFHDVFNRLNRAASENRQVRMSNSSVLKYNHTQKSHDTQSKMNETISDITSFIDRGCPPACLF